MDALFDAPLFSAIDVRLIRERWDRASGTPPPCRKPTCATKRPAVLKTAGHVDHGRSQCLPGFMRSCVSAAAISRRSPAHDSRVTANPIGPRSAVCNTMATTPSGSTPTFDPMSVRVRTCCVSPFDIFVMCAAVLDDPTAFGAGLSLTEPQERLRPSGLPSLTQVPPASSQDKTVGEHR
jgi:hypothetical protein